MNGNMKTKFDISTKGFLIPRGVYYPFVPLSHSLTTSLSHSLTQSLTQSPAQAVTHSVTHSVILAGAYGNINTDFDANVKASLEMANSVEFSAQALAAVYSFRVTNWQDVICSLR